MPFIVKATYRNETRKFTFNDPYFPSYDQLYHQLYRVFSVGHSYYLSKLLFSPQEGARILIGMEAHSAEDYETHIAPFKGLYYPAGRLTFSVYDETPHKVPVSRAPASFIHPIPPVPPIPFFAPPPPPPPPLPRPPQQQLGFSMPHTFFNPPRSPPFPMDISESEASTTKRDSATTTATTECCKVAEGKKEVRTMMDTFLRDFTRIMGSTFGDDKSFFDPLGTPSLDRSVTPRPLTPVHEHDDLEASLPIPGSFIQPRPHSPDIIGNDVEKSQTPPQLEPLQTLHPNIWCDFCGKQIKGLRFKCQECANYDLCANCIVVNQALDKHNADQMWIHRFSTISPPTRDDPAPRLAVSPIVPPSVVSAQESVVDRSNACTRPVGCCTRTVTCDMCDQTVVGTRHKCMDCPDYDLCDKCIGNAPMQHPHHRFLKVPTTAFAPVGQEPVVHMNILCDLCDLTVVGNRHKCLDCPNYDLCDKCISNAPTQHPDHEFLKIETPGRVIVHTVAAREPAAPPPAPEPTPAAHNATCNLCDSRIVGNRYKCTGCPDFDTCAACFAITPQHHPEHVFVRVAKPEDVMSRPPPDKVYHFATCDGCNHNIVGVRYKCMHTECPDFDLCENCEALPIAVHPATHPFLKIRSAETRIPVVQRKQPAPAPSSTPPAREPTPVPVTTAIEMTPVATPAQEVLPSPSPSVSTPVERLHAIRMQAERRLSARRHQLQIYPFTVTDGEDAHAAVDPTIEERLIRERQEAEEKAQAVDRELEELEKARMRKHEDALAVGALNAFDGFAAAGREAMMSMQSGVSTPLDGSEYPSLEEIEQSSRPEMIQRKSSFFGSPFIHPLDSPLQATFLSDNNIPDGHIFPAGAEFVKSWRARNDGPEAWAEGTEVVFVAGPRLGAFPGAPTTYEIGNVAPGEEIDICAGDMKAPEYPGRYISHWRMRDPQGRYFGPRMWCDIEVLELESDHSQHGSLVNSAVIMPETAPEQSPSVDAAANLLSNPSSPITVPSSAVTLSEGAGSDDGSSSVGSVSLVEHSDSDWDDVPDAPSPHRLSGVPPPPPRRADDDVEYLVLYDSSDSNSDEA